MKKPKKQKPLKIRKRDVQAMLTATDYLNPCNQRVENAFIVTRQLNAWVEENCDGPLQLVAALYLQPSFMAVSLGGAALWDSEQGYYDEQIEGELTFQKCLQSYKTWLEHMNLGHKEKK